MQNNLRTILTSPFIPTGKRRSEHDSSHVDQAIGWAFSAHRLWARAHLLPLHSITPSQARSPGPAHGLVNMDLTKKSPRMLVVDRAWLTKNIPSLLPISFQKQKSRAAPVAATGAPSETVDGRRVCEPTATKGSVFLLQP